MYEPSTDSNMRRPFFIGDWIILHNFHKEHHGAHCSPECRTAVLLWKFGKSLGLSNEDMHDLKLSCKD